jgi:hypothetical protein
MTINYTTLLGLAKPVTGTESGTWGDVVNDQITSLVEDAIANAASLNVTSGNVTLTDNNGSSDQARMAILLVTGTPGVSRNIVAPSTSKWYIVKNGSNAEVVLKGSATTGVTIPAGVEALAFWNGSDFELVSMVGPSSSTDNAITRYDGTTGKVVQNSGVTIDDSNNMTGVVALTTTGVVTVPAGSEAAPAITTTGDTNTGIFFPAADTIAFSEGGTESVRIDSSGNVGIGTASPGYSATNRKVLALNGGSGAGEGAILAFMQGGTNKGYLLSAQNTIELWSESGEVVIGNNAAAAVKLLTNNTERMRITAGGDVGIGTASPSGKLDVVGSGGTFRVGSAGDSISFTKGGTNYISTSTAGGQLLFQTGASVDRMLITSGGDVLVGRTTAIAGERLCVEGSNTTFIARMRNTSATTPAGLFVSYTAAAPNGTGDQFLRCDDNAATRAEIRSNGGLANYSGNDVNLSDRREKTNFAPAKSYLDTICSIPIQTFNYIDQNLEDDPGLTLGVVAQDVQAVAPELVMESNWGTEDNPKMRLSIYQTDLQYALMKCIQELKTELDSVKAELAALKGA